MKGYYYDTFIYSLALINSIKMEERLERIIQEKISADHLLYVSLKYTKTCDVMVNLLKRWKIMIDHSVEAILEKARRKKMIKVIPTAPKLQMDLIKELFSKDPKIMEVVEIYPMFKLIDTLKKTREGEFRKGVCLRVFYKGDFVVINMDKLMEYAGQVESFINSTRDFIVKK